MPAKQTHQTVAESEILAVAAFRFALRRFEQQTDTIVRACGLTPQRYLLLLAVRSAEATDGFATGTQIANDLQMPQTTVADLISRAVGVGLLAKNSGAVDGRVVHITTTPEGDERLARAIGRLAGERANLEHALSQAAERFA
jgi:DNA-binding MarR family transcriptional regulator